MGVSNPLYFPWSSAVVRSALPQAPRNVLCLGGGTPVPLTTEWEAQQSQITYTDKYHHGPSYPRAQFLDINKLEAWTQGPYDCVLALRCSPFIDHVPAFFAQCHRLLMHDGVVIIDWISTVPLIGTWGGETVIGKTAEADAANPCGFVLEHRSEGQPNPDVPARYAICIYRVA